MGENDFASGVKEVSVGTAKDGEQIALAWNAYRCPNPKCHRTSLTVAACFGTWGYGGPGNQYRFTGKFDPNLKPADPVGLGVVRFLPRVSVPLSQHVPNGVRQDYDEACTISDLSPKAAATLCRRALQGMVRDFWNVSERTLHEELKKIQDRCDPELFNALMAIKSIGNIGAHPEVDISVIVDVEEGEVQALVSVLQILDQEWYVERAQRRERLAKVHALGAAKAEARQPNATGALVPPRAS